MEQAAFNSPAKTKMHALFCCYLTGPGLTDIKLYIWQVRYTDLPQTEKCALAATYCYIVCLCHLNMHVYGVSKILTYSGHFTNA